MKYIYNLSEEVGVTLLSILVGLPSDNRAVLLFDTNPQDIPICAYARYKEGKWYGLLTGEHLAGLSNMAHWQEAIIFTPKCVATWDNVTNKEIKD